MPRSRVVPCAALLGLALAAAALVHATHGAAASARADTVVRVVERDFRITVSPARVGAGTVVFRVTNDGPDAHEFIVIRDNGGIPLRSDGITVNEEALTKRIVNGLEPGHAGARRDLRVRLSPGRYLLVCNMFGHYMGGMQATLVVR